MATTPSFVATYRSQQTQLVNAHATRPRPIWTPGANGSRLHSINMASDDPTNSYTVTFYRAVPLTLATNMGTATLTKNTSVPDTITRTTGSFLTDGWLANQRLFVLGSTTLANDVLIPLSNSTPPTATTLSITASTFNNSETFPSTGKLYMASVLGTFSVPQSAGSSVPPVSALTPAQLPTLFGTPDNFLILGANDLLIAAVLASVATGKSVDFVIEGGDY